MATYGYTGTVQTYTVKISGTYDLSVLGAKGGDAYSQGGFGAQIGGTIFLTQGQQVRVVVGGLGQEADGGTGNIRQTNGGGGGGGSSAIYTFGQDGSIVPLIVAGGGGGAGSREFTDGAGATGSSASAPGAGTGGARGGEPHGGAGGAGAFADGVSSQDATGGLDLAHGSAGGIAQPGAGDGGFGGGGAGGYNSDALGFSGGGGGGGYTGGAAGGGPTGAAGQAGTSYLAPSGTLNPAETADAVNPFFGSASLTIISAPSAPTGSFPLNGNRVVFDGTTNVTATKGDALIVTLDPQSFNGGAEQNGSVVLSSIDGHTATIGNAFLTSDGIPNVYVPNGDFLVGRDGFGLNSTKQNSILIGLPGSQFIKDVVDPSLPAGSHFISGGVGRTDQTDGDDVITIGGKGRWAVYANAGDDELRQDTASTSGFDSASQVNVYGQEGNDTVTFTNAANKASLYVAGGAGADSIAVVNSGVTVIQGGIDSTDGGDAITISRVSGQPLGGISYVYGNGGNDTINVTSDTRTDFDSTTISTIFGGYGDDRIQASGGVQTVIGGEGSDSIAVAGYGAVYVTGGNPSGAEQSLDSADAMEVSGFGDIAAYGNLGDDSIAVGSFGAGNVQVYGGKDNDLIFVNDLSGEGKASILAVGGEGSDSITASSNGSALTIYGGINGTDAADGSDSIVLTSVPFSDKFSTGDINIFANGGSDTVVIAGLGNDSIHTATVYGGGGTDSIVIGPQFVGNEALVVYGNENADSFSIAASSTAGMVRTAGSGRTITIADFKPDEGDTLKITALGGTTGTLQVTTGTFQTLQQALDAAANQANATTANQSKAAGIVFAGSTYVVIDNTANGNTGGFTATDQAIKLTGVTDLVGVIGATTLSAA